MKVRGKFYGGTSGLVLPVANKLAFPPAYQDKSRLTYYASLFNSLEVNSSFYKIPMATIKRWAIEVPEGFKFTFKLFKGITHNKGLVFEDALVEKFMQVDRITFFKTFTETFPGQKLLDSEMLSQLNHIQKAEFRQPFAVMAHLSFLGVKDLKGLLGIGTSIFGHFFWRHDFARLAAIWITNKRSE